MFIGFSRSARYFSCRFCSNGQNPKKTAAGEITGINCACTTETVNHTTATSTSTLEVAIRTAESQLERKSEREKEINKGQQGTWNYGRFDRDFNRGE